MSAPTLVEDSLLEQFRICIVLGCSQVELILTQRSCFFVGGGGGVQAWNKLEYTLIKNANTILIPWIIRRIF